MRFRPGAIEAKSPSAASTPATDEARRRTRRPVSMCGHVIRASEITLDVVLLDLNYDGCGIEVGAELCPGELVKLSVTGRGFIDAEVRWYKDGKAGLRFAPIEAPTPPVHRDTERAKVASEVRIRRLGQNNYNVRIFDFSPSGCKVEVVERPRAGEHVSIKFEGIEPLVAEVCWVEGFTVGLRFERPLHPAVFDLLLARLQQ